MLLHYLGRYVLQLLQELFKLFGRFFILNLNRLSLFQYFLNHIAYIRALPINSLK